MLFKTALVSIIVASVHLITAYLDRQW